MPLGFSVMFLSESEFRRISESRLQIVCSGAHGDAAPMTAGQALQMGNQLLEELGIATPERLVLLLLPHSVELFCLHLALAFRGQVPAILPWPTSRIDAAKYQRNLIHQLRGLPAARLITLPTLAENLGRFLGFPVSGVCGSALERFETGFAEKFDGPADLPETQAAQRTGRLPDEALFLQFSGGTTGMQKCVVVTEGLLRSQLDRLQTTLQFSERDTVVSWLPLYHDMGLIACLWLPIWCGATGVHIAAADWLLAPEKLFSLVEEHHGTFCWLPNFAFSYLAQRKRGMRGAWNLGLMRAWISCSEPVRERSLREFVDAFGDWGVTEGQVQSSYAMAETVFAVSQSRLGTAPRVIVRESVQASGEGAGRLAFSMPGNTFVSSGSLLEETSVRIVDGTGTVCGAGVAGEIELRSSSLFSGYWGANGFQTECFTGDGWYKTGDYGFVDDGELYVVGRFKDLIIVGGQNVFPEDVESIVNEVEGVYPGRVVAFAMEDEIYGTQSIAVIAETKGNAALSPAALEKEIRSRVLTGIGVAPRYVKAVPDRWIVKSTAGKISRKETREKFVSELNEMKGNG